MPSWLTVALVPGPAHRGRLPDPRVPVPGPGGRRWTCSRRSWPRPCSCCRRWTRWSLVGARPGRRPRAAAHPAGQGLLQRRPVDGRGGRRQHRVPPAARSDATLDPPQPVGAGRRHGWPSPLVNLGAFVGVLLAGRRAAAPTASWPSCAPAIVRGSLDRLADQPGLRDALRRHLRLDRRWPACCSWSPWRVLHWAGRAYASVRADRARLAGMQLATHALAVPMNPRDAIPEFLAEVRRCFESEVAELVILLEGSRVVHRSREDEPGGEQRVEEAGRETLAAALMRAGKAVRVSEDDGDRELTRRLRDEGWRDCLAAPVRVEGKVIGVLCTYNRTGFEGFEEGELAVLDALAAEVGTAIEKGELLEAILEERTKLSEIVEHTSDGIAALDPDGTVSSWNPGFEEITGYRSADMVGSRGLARLRPRDVAGREVQLDRWADDEGAAAERGRGAAAQRRGLLAGLLLDPGPGGRRPAPPADPDLPRHHQGAGAEAGREGPAGLGGPLPGAGPELLPHGDRARRRRRHHLRQPGLPAHARLPRGRPGRPERVRADPPRRRRRRPGPLRRAPGRPGPQRRVRLPLPGRRRVLAQHRGPGQQPARRPGRRRGGVQLPRRHRAQAGRGPAGRPGPGAGPDRPRRPPDGDPGRPGQGDRGRGRRRPLRHPVAGRRSPRP